MTNDFPTIQAAINAAGSNDTIQVQAGTYRESLNIVAPVHIIGSGSTNCIVHHTNDVLVTISSAGTVELAGMEIVGGEVAFGGGFSPTVPQGIVATNTTLALNDAAVNNTRNYAVTVLDGSLYATNVALYSRIILQQWDVGFQLKGCFARIYQLTQQAGQIDHTVNINDPPANFSDVRVENSTIRASHLGYGECVRTYSGSSVVISNCDLYRAPGGDAVTIGNQAIGVNGFSNIVIITANLIDSLPVGMRIFGSFSNSNFIKIEHNDIVNCASDGVLAVSLNYPGVDLGGGTSHSAGQNYFYNPGARDVELSGTSANMSALSNCWTTANPDDSIIDQLDTPSLGRVTHNPTFCEVTNITCSLVPALITNGVGLADTVLATVTTNGVAAAGVPVSFSVTSGPNSGQGSNVTTSVSGQTSFRYVSNGTNGTDIIQAIATVDQFSATGTATKVWIGPPPNQPPMAVCKDVTTNATGGCVQNVLASAVDNSSFDPDGTITNLTLSPAGPYATGITSVTLTVTDNQGATNSCQATITVLDKTLPTISCAGDVVANIPFGQSQVNVFFGAPTASDNCGGITTNCTPVSGSAFALGTNIVTCTAIDSSANTNSCSFHVIVLSLPAPNQPPVALCSNITVNADANCQATVSALAVDAGSFDSDGTITSRSLNPAVPFTVGTNNITLTVVDDQSASNSCNAQIIVVDVTPPSIGPCADIVTNVAAGVTNAVVDFALPAASDNCGLATNYCSPASGSVFAVGTNVVTGTAVDTSGNTNTCSFSVIVLAALPPSGDLAVLSVKPPSRIGLTNKKPSQTKSVKVAIQNLGIRTETIDGPGTFTNLLTLTIESLGVCPVPTASIVPPKKGFPIVLKPKKKLTVVYNVTYDCANDDTRGTGHEDFRYTATVNHIALDGHTDTQPSNDGCPRSPNPAIGDKGCGSKGRSNGQLGADILTDVEVK